VNRARIFHVWKPALLFATAALSREPWFPKDGPDREPDDEVHRMPGMQMIWPYDDRARLEGEYQWEPEPSKAELFKLDPADVLTSDKSGKLLAPFIKPLPNFEEFVLGKRPAAA
jgi:hypothetical protein